MESKLGTIATQFKKILDGGDAPCGIHWGILFSTLQAKEILCNIEIAIAEDATLRAELDAVKRERDAAVADLTEVSRADTRLEICDVCKFHCGSGCSMFDNGDGQCNFEWRGVQEATNADQTAQD